MIKAKAAFGKCYASQVDAMRDYEKGIDFKLVNGPYFSIRDFESLRKEALIDKTLYGEEYVLEIFFYSTTKNGFDKFYVGFTGKCHLAQ